MSHADLDRTFAARFAQLLLRRRWWFLAGVLAFAILAGLSLTRLRFDNSVESFFLRGDKTLAMYDTFKDRFQSDEYVLLSLDAPESWSPAYVARVRAFVAQLEKLPHVLEVTAITNVRYIEGQEDELIVGKFLGEDDSEDNPERLAARRALAMSHPYYKDLYISGDGKHLGVVVKTEIIPNEFDYKLEITRKMRALIGSPAYTDWNIKAVGPPLLDSDVRVIVTRESALFGALCFLLVIAGFLMVFRSAIGVLLPVTVAGLSIVGTFGVMAAVGAPIGLLSPIIPSFMISVGVGACIYLITEIYQEIAAGKSVRDAVLFAISTSGVASFMSVFTTAGGILAFASSKVRPVAELGFAMGLGLLISFALTAILVPIAFSFFKTVRTSKGRDRVLLGRMVAFEKLAGWVADKRKVIFVAFAGLMLVAVFGASRLNADFFYLGMFDHSTKIRRDYTEIDKELKGSASVELLIDTAEDGIKDPRVLGAVKELQDYVDANFTDLGAKSYSIVNVVQEINQALHGGDPAYYKIPATRTEVAQYLVLYTFSETNDLKNLVSGDYRHARLRIGTKNLPYSAYNRLFAEIHQHVQGGMLTVSQSGAPPAEAHITGLVHLWSKINSYIQSSQVQALIITSLVVMFVMMLMFRSWRLGFAMTLANACAVVVTLGIMGFAGIPLDPYTILISSIALGMLDDDTIHFVQRIQFERRNGATTRQAVATAMGSAGQAMFYMSAVLTAGFAVYGLSDVASLRKFGLLIAMTITVGSVMEFLLTPTILLVFEGWLFKKSMRAPSAVPMPAPQPAAVEVVS